MVVRHTDTDTDTDTDTQALAHALSLMRTFPRGHIPHRSRICVLEEV